MYQLGNELVFSASDLANHINCPHVTTLNRLCVEGALKKPVQQNSLLKVLQERGQEFEESYLKTLEAEGRLVVKVSQESSNPYAATLAAMKSGVDVIYQARLEKDNWKGWADFLMKVDQPSQLGDWSYEVYDTKLATNTKAATILQLSLYTEIVDAIQGTTPEYMHVQTPEGKSSYRVADYSAYYRFVQRRFLQAVAEKTDTYPDPVTHCDVCIWWEHCNAIRRADDHLRFVAGLGNLHLRELRNNDTPTLQALAELPQPIPFKPSRGAVQTYDRLREQARLQLEVRNTKRPVYQLLPREEEKGLFLLPEPDADDVFLDLEGDPMVLPSGREYIFGWYHKDEYHIIWAEDEAAEKAGFEQFIDTVMTLLDASPNMHIYHFGAYEVSAFKRLMCRYGTRIEQMDQLLRAKKYIDLHTVVKQSLQAGVEKYSLKDLEKYHGFTREADLRTVAPLKAGYEFLLQTNRAAEATKEMKDVIQQYNADDCISTKHLFDWLLKIRADLRAAGEDIPPPDPKSGEPGKRVTAHQQMIKPIFDGLMEGLPVENRTVDQQVKYLLANMLDWYGREDKHMYWEKFRLEGCSMEELLDEPSAISYLEYTGERDVDKSYVLDVYNYPVQECDLRVGDGLNFINLPQKATIHSIDRISRRITIKKPGSQESIHPLAVYRFKEFDKVSKIASIVNLAIVALEEGLDYQNLKCAFDLLRRRPPDIIAPLENDTDNLDRWIEWALKLNNSVLPIQGPPGTGKTYTASRIIVALVEQGKRVGITALSHKVIAGLMEGVYNAAQEKNISIDMLQKPDTGNTEKNGKWDKLSDYEAIKKKLSSYQVIGGTPNFWTHNYLQESIDYLFVDEAGQLSLVDTLVCCFATKNLILLGDPQQLKQPQQGVHPDGVDVSSLEHILGDAKTIQQEQGIFLSTTRRMHPNICAFDGEMFYEGRLSALPELAFQEVSGNFRYSGAGMIFHPVPHTGNTNFSVEEVCEVYKLIQELVKGDVFWTDALGASRVLMEKDIKVIAPYNLQVSELKEILGNIEVGTVDKFQGQEAPVIIYSMTTSTPEDAPRGMEFLYSPNRFNVAVSRAKGLFILVGSPALFEPSCTSPEQIKLANPFCRFLEVSRKT